MKGAQRKRETERTNTMFDLLNLTIREKEAQHCRCSTKAAPIHKQLHICLLLVLGGLLLNGNCVMSADTDKVAVIETKFGKIVVEFYYKDAPKTTAIFLKLAGESFYNGTTFHRVIPEYIIQGGDPNSKDDDRGRHTTDGPVYTIEDEIKHKHERGTVAMAGISGKKRSYGCQFFINVIDNNNKWPSRDHPVFGYVIAGMDVVDKIATTPRDDRNSPNVRVEMNVSIATRNEALMRGKQLYDAVSFQTFQEKARAWRALTQKPPLSEDVRQFRVQAEDAFQKKEFEKAAECYEQGLAIEPLWPDGQLNAALLYGELEMNAWAVLHMKRYLELCPDAEDAKKCRDQMYIWEGKIK